MGFQSKLPKLFVIGDSISLHYGPYLKKELTGIFVYDRKGGSKDAFKNLDIPTGANGGDSGMVLAYLIELSLNDNFNTDYLIINCGLHDIKRKSMEDTCQVSLERYGKNLEDILSLSMKMHTQLIWVNSTPVVDTIHNTRVPFSRFNADVIRYNQVGDSIMNKHNIPVIDLYTFTKPFIPQGYMDHVHYKEAIREKQAQFIAQQLIALQKKD